MDVQQQLRSSTSCPLGKTHFEWTVRDVSTIFASLTKDEKLCSTIFSVNNSNNNSANFLLYYQKSINYADVVCLFVELVDKNKQVWGEYTVTLLKADGISEWAQYGPYVHTFDLSPRSGFGIFTQQMMSNIRKEFQSGQHLTIAIDITVRFGDAPIQTPLETITPTFEHGPSLSADISSLTADPSYLSDITIKCGSKTIPAHRIILSARSTVFKAMFDKNFSEGKSKEVLIKDVEPEIIDKFIKAFYSDTFNDEISNQSCLQLLKAADMYNFHYLKNVCEEKLARALDVENAASVLSWALACNAENLIRVAKKYIEVHVGVIVGTTGFNDFMRGPTGRP